MPQIQSWENRCHLITNPNGSQAKLSPKCLPFRWRDHQDRETLLSSCPFNSWPCFWAFQQAYQLVAPIVRVDFFFLILQLKHLAARNWTEATEQLSDGNCNVYRSNP